MQHDFMSDVMGEGQEKQEAAAKLPQGNGLAIRDDGILVPATPGILALPNVKPYHGDPNWSLQQRLDWLAGRTVRNTFVQTREEQPKQAQPAQSQAERPHVQPAKGQQKGDDAPRGQRFEVPKFA